MATEPAVAVEGFNGERPTKILVDTGSSVTILREDIWTEAGNTLSLEPPPSPVTAANGEQLEVRGLSEVNLRVGDICACYPVLVAKNVTQECLLGADFLEKFGCIIDLRGQDPDNQKNIVSSGRLSQHSYLPCFLCRNYSGTRTTPAGTSCKVVPIQKSNW